MTQFILKDLPYDRNALNPHISAETLDYHYGKHHQTYVTKLNGLIEGDYSNLQEYNLEDLIIKTNNDPSKTPVFNNAAQIWNHDFFWHSMKPGGGNAPTGELAKLIERDFGSTNEFLTNFTGAAVSLFGSGWTWLVYNKNTKKLEIVRTSNAETPLTNPNLVSLLTLDVWEHAYYIDFRNRRPDYISSFMNNLINFGFAAQQLAIAQDV